MRIRRLTLGRFGHFADAVLPLETGPERGLRIIYGANEAGKTTVLQAVRHLLFGFPERSPYNFLYDYGSFELTAELEFASGERAEVRRVKGRRQTLFARIEATGEEGDERWLKRRLGEPTEDLFANVFGFSLWELEQGTDSLKGDVRDALYGGGLGSVNLEGICRQLAREMDSLLRPAATASRPMINAALNDLRDRSAALDAATVRAPQFERLREQLRQAESDAAAAQSRLGDLRRRQAALDRAARALPKQALRRDRAEELEGLVVPREFASDCAARFGEATRERESLSRSRHQLEAELGRIDEDLAGLSVDERVLAVEQRIDDLFSSLKMVREATNDLPAAQAQYDQLKPTIARDLATLRPGTDESHLTRFAPQTLLRRRFDDALAEAERLATQRRDLTTRRSDLVDRIKAADEKLSNPVESGDTAAIEGLLALEGDYEADRRELVKREEALRLATQRVRAARRKLDPPCAQTEGAELLPVPRVEQVQAMESELARLEEVQRLAEERLRTAAARRTEIEAGLSEAARQHLPTEEALTASRAHRERGWALVRRAWIAGDDVAAAAAEFDAERGLPEAYESAVRAADACADELRAHASEVAERARLERELQRQRDEMASAEQRVGEAREAVAECRTRWRALWERCPFEPDSPATMRGWLADHARLCEQSTDRTVHEQECDRLRASISAFEAHARDVLSDAASPVESLLAAARKRVEDSRDQDSRRRATAEARDADALALAEVQRALSLLETDERRWRERWAAVAEEMALPAGIEPADAGRVVRSLDDTRQRAVAADDLARRIRAMDTTLRSFATEASDLARAVMPEAQEARPEDIARRLHAAAVRAREDLQKRSERQARRDAVVEQLEITTLGLQECDQAVADLLARAEAADEAAFAEVAARAEKADALRREIDGLDRELREIRAEGPTEELDALLAQADPEGLEQSRATVRDELAIAQVESEQANQRVGQARSDLSRVDGGARAAAIREDIQAALAELRGHAERYAVLAVARKLLDDEVTRFGVEHQPELLARAGAIFAHMTAGRYSGVSRLLDERGTIMANRADGKMLTPVQLSTGAAQQLYLALRLAYIQHYCARSEPLPLVMDDVLVNFDDARAEATLRTLAELSTEIQVLFFTCHPHLVELARGVVPGLTPIDVPPAG